MQSVVKKHIGYFQFAPLFGDVHANLKRVVAALDGTAADLIVLPELAFSGYSFRDRREVRDLAEDVHDSPTVNRLADLCRQNGFYLVTGFAEKCAGKVYNSALMLGPTGLVDVYRKLHLFNSEKNCFDPGDRPLRVNAAGAIRVGMMICFDWAFPEVARTLALQGADLLCHPSNLVLDHCQQAMGVRCTENLIYAVTANRWGTETRPHGTLTFTGKSQVMAPKGILVHQSATHGDELVVVEVDIALARDKRITARNHVIDDRRPEFYHH